MDLLEDLVVAVWPTPLQPFVVIPHQEAIALYGTDKPDLRYELLIDDAQQLLPTVAERLPEGHCVRALRLADGAELVKSKHIKEWREAAKQFGLNGTSFARRRGVEVSKCRGVKVSQCRGVKVSKCRGVETLRCRGPGSLKKQQKKQKEKNETSDKSSNFE